MQRCCQLVLQAPSKHLYACQEMHGCTRTCVHVCKRACMCTCVDCLHLRRPQEVGARRAEVLLAKRIARGCSNAVEVEPAMAAVAADVALGIIIRRAAHTVQLRRARGDFKKLGLGLAADSQSVCPLRHLRVAHTGALRSAARLPRARDALHPPSTGVPFEGICDTLATPSRSRLGMSARASDRPQGCRPHCDRRALVVTKG